MCNPVLSQSDIICVHKCLFYFTFVTVLSEMDPHADLDRWSISDKSYFAWQKWTPLSITQPIVSKFIFDMK